MVTAPQEMLTILGLVTRLELMEDGTDRSCNQEHDDECKDGIHATIAVLAATVGAQLSVDGVEDSEEWEAPSNAFDGRVVARWMELVDNEALRARDE